MQTSSFDSEALEEVRRFETRSDNYRKWMDKHMVKEVKPGDKLDVLDTEYIWCPASVELKVLAENRAPLLYLHYDGWSRKYDEYLYSNSSRIAPQGTYTKRRDIPRYRMMPNLNNYIMYAQVSDVDNNRPAAEEPA